MPTPLFITSPTASVAFCTFGNCTTATVVGSTGANRIVAYNTPLLGIKKMFLERASGKVPSVIIPRVPSAPMNNLVVSKPADDLRDLRRVLMTSPEGKTTVLGYPGHRMIKSNMLWNLPRSRTIRLWLFHIEQHLLSYSLECGSFLKSR